MCYHTSTPSKKNLLKGLAGYNVKYADGTNYRVSGFTRPFAPATLNQEPKDIVSAQWKLLPFWIKNEDEAKKLAGTLNAESEDIFDNPSYRNYIGKYRGLLWVTGFYESYENKATKMDENYYIYAPDKEIISLGIVYTPWINKDTGDVINTFSVITTSANSDLKETDNYNKRMPLIIDEQKRDAWLLADDKAEIQSLMQPYPGELQSLKVAQVAINRIGSTNRERVPQMHG